MKHFNSDITILCPQMGNEATERNGTSDERSFTVIACGSTFVAFEAT